MCLISPCLKDMGFTACFVIALMNCSMAQHTASPICRNDGANNTQPTNAERTTSTQYKGFIRTAYLFCPAQRNCTAAGRITTNCPRPLPACGLIVQKGEPGKYRVVRRSGHKPKLAHIWSALKLEQRQHRHSYKLTVAVVLI